MLNKLLTDLREHVESRSAPLPPALLYPSTAVHITSRWEGRAVYAVFDGRDKKAPSLVFKVDSRSAYQPRLRTEYKTLCWYSARSGVADRMPHPVALFTTGRHLALAQTGVPGVPLNVLLRRRIRSGPERCARDHAMVLNWLAALHDSTDSAASVPLEAERAVKQMAAGLPDDRAVWEPFLAAMTASAERFADLHVPLLPGHGDLAPSNCMVHGSAVGVIDWEGGLEPREPLADIVVFLNHYARALPKQRHRLPDPVEAFRRAFIGEGWLARVTAASLRGELARLGLPVEAAEFLFVSTLADLAAGEASTAHGHRSGSRRNWSALLAAYAEDFRASALRTETPV